MNVHGRPLAPFLLLTLTESGSGRQTILRAVLTSGQPDLDPESLSKMGVAEPTVPTMS